MYIIYKREGGEHCYFSYRESDLFVIISHLFKILVNRINIMRHVYYSALCIFPNACFNPKKIKVVENRMKIIFLGTIIIVL